MKYHNITKPIGLTAACQEILHTCNDAYLYRWCGLRPSHFIINLDPGCGRTTLVEYMTGMYKESGVLNFRSSLDDYIEISFDGSLKQLNQAFATINAAAVYSNAYCNIISMDISNLATHLGERQIIEFLNNCKRVCKHACVLFFVHTMPSRNEKKLLEKLCESTENIKRIFVEPYTKDDICDLIVKTIKDHGITIKHDNAFHSVLEDVVSAFDITSVKAATAVADTIVRFADFSTFTPTVDENSLKLMITRYYDNKEVKSNEK